MKRAAKTLFLLITVIPFFGLQRNQPDWVVYHSDEDGFICMISKYREG